MVRQVLDSQQQSGHKLRERDLQILFDLFLPFSDSQRLAFLRREAALVLLNQQKLRVFLFQLRILLELFFQWL